MLSLFLDNDDRNTLDKEKKNLSHKQVQTVKKSVNLLRVRRIQTGSGSHPASYPMGTRGYFPGGKAAGA
jgi:hypothetical protein